MAKQTQSEGAAVVRMEPRASTAAGWNPSRIRAAEIRCALGDYSLAAELCEDMMADERVTKALDRLYAAMTLPLAFQLPGKDAEQSKADPICQALDADWWKLLPEQQGKTLMRWLGLFGLAFGHLDGYKLDEETGRAIPLVSVWSPRNLRNDAENGWQARTTTSPSDRAGTWENITPGDGNWFAIIAGGNYRGPFQAPWRGIARWWLLKLYAQIDWAASSERHGQGIAVVSNTLTGTSDMADTGEPIPKPERKVLANEIATMGRNGAIILPRGWEMEIATDGANTYQTFVKQVDYANNAIDIGITGTNLTTEVDGGSRAAASVHATVDSVRMSSLLELVSTAAHDQILPYWRVVNFGAGLTPYPKWDTRPPADKKSEAEAKVADANAFKAYVDAGAQIDQIAWFEGKVQLIPGASQEVKKPAAPNLVQPTGDNGTEDRSNAPAPPKKKPAAFAKARDPKTSFARGRAYADDLEQQCCRHATVDLAPTLGSVLAALQGASNFDEAKQRLMDAYRNEPAPSELLDRTEKALVLGQLAGRETIEQEAQTED